MDLITGLQNKTAFIYVCICITKEEIYALYEI